MSEVCYAIQLTKCELDEVRECCTPEMNKAVLRHARPEHPDRQAALEELLKVAEQAEGWRSIARAVRKVRSLEGK